MKARYIKLEDTTYNLTKTDRIREIRIKIRNRAVGKFSQYTERRELPLFAICNFFDQLDGFCPIHHKIQNKSIEMSAP